MFRCASTRLESHYGIQTNPLPPSERLLFLQPITNVRSRCSRRGAKTSIFKLISRYVRTSRIRLKNIKCEETQASSYILKQLNSRLCLFTRSICCPTFSIVSRFESFKMLQQIYVYFDNIFLFTILNYLLNQTLQKNFNQSQFIFSNTNCIFIIQFSIPLILQHQDSIFFTKKRREKRKRMMLQNHLNVLAVYQSISPLS